MDGDSFAVVGRSVDVAVVVVVAETVADDSSLLLLVGLPFGCCGFLSEG